jgi:hypothetical protein
MYTASDFHATQRDVAFEGDLKRNEQLLQQTARTVVGGTYVQGWAGGDPARMARELTNRGFRTEVTHNGNGFRIYYR